MTHRTTPLDPPLVLHDIRQTCVHFPAQWTARTDDGRDVLISAELGGAEVTVSDATGGGEESWDWDHAAWDGDPGPPWEEVAEVTGLRLGGA